MQPPAHSRDRLTQAVDILLQHALHRFRVRGVIGVIAGRRSAWLIWIKDSRAWCFQKSAVLERK
jgi:exonuclease VII large subunit